MCALQRRLRAVSEDCARHTLALNRTEKQLGQLLSRPWTQGSPRTGSWQACQRDVRSQPASQLLLSWQLKAGYSVQAAPTCCRASTNLPHCCCLFADAALAEALLAVAFAGRAARHQSLHASDSTWAERTAAAPVAAPLLRRLQLLAPCMTQLGCQWGAMSRAQLLLIAAASDLLASDTCPHICRSARLACLRHFLAGCCHAQCCTRQQQACMARMRQRKGPHLQRSARSTGTLAATKAVASSSSACAAEMSRSPAGSSRQYCCMTCAQRCS